MQKELKNSTKVLKTCMNTIGRRWNSLIRWGGRWPLLKPKLSGLVLFCGPELLHCGTNGGDMWTGQRDLEPSGSWGYH